MTLKQYSRKLNALRRAQDVQEFYREVRVEGQPDAYVWRTHIYPRFKISLSLFYEYLGTRPALEIEKLEKRWEKAKGGVEQTSLFS